MGPEGGIKIPSVPPAAMTPSPSRSGYPNRFICGSALAPIERAVATDDPEMAAKIVQERTVATPRPPLTWPTIALAKS